LLEVLHFHLLLSAQAGLHGSPSLEHALAIVEADREPLKVC